MKTNFIFEDKAETKQTDTRRWSEPNEYGEAEYIAPSCPDGVDPADYDKDMLQAVISGVIKDEYDPFSESLYPYEPKYMHAELYYDDKHGDEPQGVSSDYNADGPNLTGGLLDVYHGEDIVAKNHIEVETHFASSDENITLCFDAAHVNTNDQETDYDSWSINVHGYYTDTPSRRFNIFSINAVEAPVAYAFNNSKSVDSLLGTIITDSDKFSCNIYDIAGKIYGRTSGEFAEAWVKLMAEHVIDICTRAFIR